MHDPRTARPAVQPPQTDWEVAYWRKQAEFAAETLRTSQLTSERDQLRTEVERLRREQSVELANAEARADTLAEQVARLEASQLPGGGQWVTQDGHLLVGGRFCACSFPSHSKNRPQATRRVWYSPPEPIGPVSDSGPRSEVDPADDTQTTPRPA